MSRSDLLAAALLASLLAAPTVGDVGTCGKAATDLDPGAFASARKTIDCRRCTQCRIATRTCANACDPAAPSNAGLSPTCRPLRHDGDVCVRALQAASCDDYATFVDDVAPATPTECDFCRLVPEAGAIDP